MSVITKLREKYRLRAAIKETLDGLPSAVCYFTPSGSIKLCNSAMYSIYRRLAQSDLQYYSELTSALENCDRATGIIRDGNVFIFPDGRAMQYSAREIKTANGRRYTEAVFSDVTELYEKRRELERQSKELKKMYAELSALSGRLLEITREQEILNMKAGLHDRMNVGITAIRQTLRQHSTGEENAAAIARFRSAIMILQEESAAPGDELDEFISDAEVSGVKVNLSGSLPEDEGVRSLLVAAMREACVNAARHADAYTLNISSVQTEESVTVRMTNDGNPPSGETVPRGGLADLGRKIKEAGGEMRITSLPAFVLEVTLPVKQQEKREEAEG